MAGKFTAVSGPFKGLTLNLEEGSQWVIGRDPKACDLTLDDPLVSRRHLFAKQTQDGIQIENLSLTNPALINNAPLSLPTLLKDGDQVFIGNSVFTYSSQGSKVNETSNESPPQQNQASNRLVQREQVDGSDQEPTLYASSDNPPSNDQNMVNGHHDTILEIDSSDRGLTEVHFDLLEAGRWILKVVAGPNNGAEFPLQPGQTYVIGTDPSNCDIVFHDISVSRQHAKLTLNEDGTILIQDLGSRNGTFVEEDKVEGSKDLEVNKLVTVGTSTFIVIDNEGERSTIISPLLPSIVKVLQKEFKKDEERLEEDVSEIPEEEQEEEAPKKPKFSLLGAFVLITLISGIFALAGVAFSTLFKTHDVAKQKIDYNEELKKVVSTYPAVRYSFNEPLGRLLLVGHVLTAVDRSQLIYDLHSLPFVKDIDDNIVIDEYVWREINQVLGQNLDWRGVAIIAPQPGKFILTGYLETRKQSDSLSDYINQNFPYPDLLENKVVVKDDLMAKSTIILRNNNLGTVNPVFADGDIKLVGVMSYGMKGNLDRAIDQMKGLSGVRTVINLVIEQKPQDAVINVTDKYKVSGYTSSGSENTNIVINGKLVSVGDYVDDLKIVEIQPRYVLLEKGGVRYRIDYNK